MRDVTSSLAGWVIMPRNRPLGVGRHTSHSQRTAGTIYTLPSPFVCQITDHPPLAFVLTDSVTFVAEKRLTGGRGHCEVLEGRLHVTEGGVTTTRHAVIMKSAARRDPQRRDNERTAEHDDRQRDEYERGANMEAEGQWAEYVNSFATAAQRQDHQHQYTRLPETHTGTAHMVSQVHIRSNRQPEEPQTEGQGHFGDHYAVFDKVGNGTHPPTHSQTDRPTDRQRDTTQSETDVCIV